MAKTKRKNAGIIVKIAFLLLAIALLVGVFFAIKSLSSNFKDDIKTFYVVLDNKTITEDVGNLSLFNKSIQIHDLVGGDFSYEIVSNKSRTFDFEIGGTRYSFADKDVYTSAFDVKKTANDLVIAHTDMQSILNKIYGDGEIKYLTPMYNDVCYFTLVIKSSSDSATQINLSFLVIVNADITDIELDTSQIVF